MAKEQDILPKYLLEFPSKLFQTDLKTWSAISGMTMRDFILTAIKEKVDKEKDKHWRGTHE